MVESVKGEVVVTVDIEMLFKCLNGKALKAA